MLDTKDLGGAGFLIAGLASSRHTNPQSEIKMLGPEEPTRSTNPLSPILVKPTGIEAS